MVDVPDSDGVSNCFLLLLLDGFGCPYEYKALAVATKFEKEDWLRYVLDSFLLAT